MPNPTPTDPQLQAKQRAARHAVDFIQSGMAVGLGTGSTAIWAVRELGARLQDGRLRHITGFPTSLATRTAAQELRIPLLPDDLPRALDLTIDGADEVDPDLNAIKGGGGALLREKIVAQASARLILVIDASKLSDRLGTKFRLPIEVLPFGWQAQARWLAALGAKTHLRQQPDHTPFHTDQGNLILDCDFGPLPTPHDLAARLDARAGIIAHGLFLNLATDLIVAHPNSLDHRQRNVQA